MLLATLAAGGCPGVDGGQIALGDFLPLDGLHHLADQTVQNDHAGVTILESNVEGLLNEVDSLLNVAGSQADHAIVAVAAAAGSLEIVTLTGLNGTQTGAAAHAVDDDSGDLGTDHVRDTFLLQADAGRRGGSHSLQTAAACAVDHVDSSQLGLSLNEHAAVLGHVRGHILRDFALRSDGITEIAVATCTNSSLSDCFIAFP